MFYCCLRKKKTTTKKKKRKHSLLFSCETESWYIPYRVVHREKGQKEKKNFFFDTGGRACVMFCVSLKLKRCSFSFLPWSFLFIYLVISSFFSPPYLAYPLTAVAPPSTCPPQLLLPANDGPLAAPRCDLSIRLSPLDLLFSQRISRGRRGRNLLCERTEEEEPGLLIDVDEAGREKGDLRWLNGTSCFGGLGCATASSRPRRKNWAFKSRAGAFPVSHAYGTDGEQKREERVWTIVVGKVAQENSLDPFHVHSSFSAESWCIQTASSVPRSQQWQCIITAAAAAANRGTRGAVRPSFALAADGPEHPKE